jgi:peptide/nickel transport system ATP-binding protein
VLFRNMKMPYTEALVRSIPKLSDKSHTRLNVIPGRPPQLVNPPVGCRFAPRCPYAQDKCVKEEPPLRESDVPGHKFACWFPVGTPEGRDALERNRAAGVPAAVVSDGAATASPNSSAAGVG